MKVAARLLCCHRNLTLLVPICIRAGQENLATVQLPGFVVSCVLKVCMCVLQHTDPAACTSLLQEHDCFLFLPWSAGRTFLSGLSAHNLRNVLSNTRTAACYDAHTFIFYVNRTYRRHVNSTLNIHTHSHRHHSRVPQQQRCCGTADIRPPLPKSSETRQCNTSHPDVSGFRAAFPVVTFFSGFLHTQTLYEAPLLEW